MADTASASSTSSSPMLRRSCDHCHGAKVRCSGEKTGCVRCQRSNKDCRYSTSHKGKAIRGHGARHQQQNATTTASIDSTAFYMPSVGGQQQDSDEAWLMPVDSHQDGLEWEPGSPRTPNTPDLNSLLSLPVSFDGDALPVTAMADTLLSRRAADSDASWHHVHALDPFPSSRSATSSSASSASVPTYLYNIAPPVALAAPPLTTDRGSGFGLADWIHVLNRVNDYASKTPPALDQTLSISASILPRVSASVSGLGTSSLAGGSCSLNPLVSIFIICLSQLLVLLEASTATIMSGHGHHGHGHDARPPPLKLRLGGFEVDRDAQHLLQTHIMGKELKRFLDVTAVCKASLCVSASAQAQTPQPQSRPNNVYHVLVDDLQIRAQALLKTLNKQPRVP